MRRQQSKQAIGSRVTSINKVMPFGLKNAGATYQRAMTTIFQDMMHKEIEAIYIDDIVVKSGALTVMRRTINPFTTIYYTKGQVASILVQIQFVSTLLSSETVLLALAYKVKSQVSYLKKLNFSSSTVKSELPSSLLITDFFELLAD
ncbi:hypothetical protein VNO77_46339 [Canavalia gladiata]|uniref:Reverse transcriptase domain-containing protein n=1 Tax=Canavalia gladiata TaxID=3824 RepID=A0AAN9JFS3_CANGL